MARAADSQNSQCLGCCEPSGPDHMALVLWVAGCGALKIFKVGESVRTFMPQSGGWTKVSISREDTHTITCLGSQPQFQPQRAFPLSQPLLPSQTKPVTQDRAASAQLYGFPSPASHPHSTLQLLQVISAQKPSITTPTRQILQHFNLSANSASPGISRISL